METKEEKVIAAETERRGEEGRRGKETRREGAEEEEEK